MNQRPSGYEPDELPDCSTPRYTGVSNGTPGCGQDFLTLLGDNAEALVRRLGHILIEQGLITPEQRQEALRSQTLYGGRLGTNLVELGAIELDDLARALAKQRGLPAALQKHFEQIPSEVVALIPARLAQKHEAVPLGFTSGSPKTLAVAFVDPGRVSAIDEFRFAAHARILATIAPELRIIHYLEKLYGIRRPLRFRQMEISQEPRGRWGTAPTSPTEMSPLMLTPPAVEPRPFSPEPTTPPPVDQILNEITPTLGFPLSAPPRQSIGFAPTASPSTPLVPTLPVTNAQRLGNAVLDSGQPHMTALTERVPLGMVDESAAARIATHLQAAPATQASPQPTAPALSASQAVDAITAASTRNEIGDAVLDYLRSSFGVGLLFIVQHEVALGWKGFAPGADVAALQSLAIPLTAPSVLRLAYQTKGIFRGGPPAEGAALDGILWRQLRAPPPRDIVVAPVVLKNRVVSLIYGHAADGRALPDAALVDLTMLCPYAAAGFIRLIQAAKRWRE